MATTCVDKLNAQMFEYGDASGGVGVVESAGNGNVAACIGKLDPGEGTTNMVKGAEGARMDASTAGSSEPTTNWPATPQDGPAVADRVNISSRRRRRRALRRMRGSSAQWHFAEMAALRRLLEDSERLRAELTRENLELCVLLYGDASPR
mmetsp:Transcript_47560/g.126091  ORF Transcript_47560/g.126091 Transcript_47560/m.126091 type:complete len:150 (+) Transcript_47560:91-540(+)